MRSISLAVLMATIGALASPTELKRRSVTTLTTNQIAAFTSYTYYAAASYCPPATTKTWSCGANCDANAGFKPVDSGGDGVQALYWYVGYDPSLKTVIVGHRGTGADNFFNLLTDVNLFLDTPSPQLFPGLPSDVMVHAGFLGSHSISAPSVLAAVNTALSTYRATSVTTVGHSLGAAIALLDAVYLPLHLPSKISFKTVVYGMPRVGNQAFADYVDFVDNKVQLTHISNRGDPIPILPGRFLGFSHPKGEIHIDKQSGIWSACSGQENESNLCNLGDNPNIFSTNTQDHSGPYGVVAHIEC